MQKMAKRRTKKQKVAAKHQFLVSWDPASSPTKTKPKKTTSEPAVKGQIKNHSRLKAKKVRSVKHTDSTVETYDLASIKRDLIKSLILAGFVFSIEIMLYLAWSK